MTTMLEKMARALCLRAGLDPDRKFKSSDYSAATDPQEFAWQEFLPDVRAALLAIREAEVGPVFMGFVHDADGMEDNLYADPEDARAVFTATIDAILNEKPETAT